MAKCVHCGKTLENRELRISVLTSQPVKCQNCKKINEISWFTVIFTASIIVLSLGFGIRILTDVSFNSLEIIIYMISVVMSVILLCPLWYKVAKIKK
ncbi:cxxc_20_cxxc protein [Clostridium cavendishii DSM 21758]|uniref:Cxxc_20_cxxc protein n=1 Tax=Clostridium cavendishii DSM 21758 TaxID=1121302 RepID=A0A1M6CGS2_9CLOT|nr:hypothetical protein [Clostridium cavendishii]SHI60230.1 cxxc_20_cxxc protein [Clostridium cavendishii DSM 21758]